MPILQPMWHCYECNAEMRPLMMPEPRCASCHSDFVEMIENTEDDPRAFQRDVHPAHDHEHGGFAGNEAPLGADQGLEMFQVFLGGLGGPQRRTIRIDRRTGPNVRDSTGDFRSGGVQTAFSGAGPGAQGFIFTTTGGGGVSALPELHTIFQSYPGDESPGTATPGPGGPPNFLRQLLMGMLGAPLDARGGQFGDYALNNEALDAIITQLMEQSNGDKPVPAPDDVIARLPRTKVAANSPLLSQDCAVCKDSFEVTQDTISLPCNHSFHDECILPWIKSSGTCPVCRFELVPQPKHNHGGPAGPSAGSGTGPGGWGWGENGSRNGGAFSSQSSGSSNTSSSTNTSANMSFPGGWGNGLD